MSEEPAPAMLPGGPGLLVGVSSRIAADGHFWAEVIPAPLRHWRPWPGRTSRWWYEVHSSNPRGPAVDDVIAYYSTWAYDDAGSGGGFTLAQCILRASEAVEKFVWEDYERRSGGRRSARLFTEIESTPRGVRGCVRRARLAITTLASAAQSAYRWAGSPGAKDQGSDQ